MPPVTSALVLSQLVALRDTLATTRIETRDVLTRAAEAREMARQLRTEAERLRRTARVSFRALP